MTISLLKKFIVACLVTLAVASGTACAQSSRWLRICGGPGCFKACPVQPCRSTPTSPVSHFASHVGSSNPVPGRDAHVLWVWAPTPKQVIVEVIQRDIKPDFRDEATSESLETNNSSPNVCVGGVAARSDCE